MSEMVTPCGLTVIFWPVNRYPIKRPGHQWFRLPKASSRQQNSLCFINN